MVDQNSLDAIRAVMREEMDEFRRTAEAERQELSRFVDRRIKELGVEIGAIMQFIDMNSGDIADRFHDMKRELAAITDKRAGSEDINSGLELEAVVAVTEGATDKILMAAETITNNLSAVAITDPSVVAAIEDCVTAIFEACTFQDITGQRVRRVIEHLSRIEGHIDAVTAHISSNEDEMLRTVIHDGPPPPDVTQDDVDRLLNG